MIIVYRGTIYSINGCVRLICTVSIIQSQKILTRNSNEKGKIQLTINNFMATGQKQIRNLLHIANWRRKKNVINTTKQKGAKLISNKILSKEFLYFGTFVKICLQKTLIVSIWPVVTRLFAEHNAIGAIPVTCWHLETCIQCTYKLSVMKLGKAYLQLWWSWSKWHWLLIEAGLNYRWS